MIEREVLVIAKAPPVMFLHLEMELFLGILRNKRLLLNPLLRQSILQQQVLLIMLYG